MAKLSGSSDLELRHLRSFLTLVEHRSFRGAAEALWASQSALSRTIAQMEHIVGQKLIERGHNGVSLSAAGERFLPYAARAVAAADDAVKATASRQSTLRVGFSWNALGRDTAPLIKEFEEQNPGARVELRRIDDVPYAGLEDGRSHAAILRGTLSDPSIKHVLLYEESRVAALPKGHPAAVLREVTLDDIRHDPLVLNIISGTTMRTIWKDGESTDRPVIGVHNLEEWLEAIAAGRGIGLSSALTPCLHPHPWVVYRPVRDAPPLPVRLCWDAVRPHPLTPRFVALARARTKSGPVCDPLHPTTLHATAPDAVAPGAATATATVPDAAARQGEAHQGAARQGAVRRGSARDGRPPPRVGGALTTPVGGAFTTVRRREPVRSGSVPLDRR
ncbi:LysR family transcriptional regulator [Streptomyces varsoviensis]|uniref:LysR family transcriptional regulator n=1 Tax=Streptomyces varsoviensis TaxID=67373 RepID=UPI0009961991|nr:LysR family transcriptional regulator [Streptomyces varsoviensis]